MEEQHKPANLNFLLQSFIVKTNDEQCFIYIVDEWVIKKPLFQLFLQFKEFSALAVTRFVCLLHLAYKSFITF